MFRGLSFVQKCHKQTGILSGKLVCCCKKTATLCVFVGIYSTFFSFLQAQTPLSQDSLQINLGSDSLRLALLSLRDSIPALDSTGLDSLAAQVLQDTAAPANPVRTYTLSPDGLDAQVRYQMRDSMHYDIEAKKIHLYGEAKVFYEDIELSAGYMIIDYGSKIVEAMPRVDSAGQSSEKPAFAQGSQSFTAQRLRYNFETRKGMIYNAATQQDDLYVLGGKTKLVAADENQPGRDQNTIYNSNAIITTCELDHPHYGIRSRKQKVIPGKQVIIGPSNLELGGIPTPLWLPFGFFPIGSQEKSGLIFPSDYTYTNVDGFGFQGVGWYFPWNERIHTSVTSDIFLKGTLRLDVVNTYAKRYKYSGEMTLGFARNRGEDEGLEVFSESYGFRWLHQQDPKAHPYRRFTSNVNFQTNNYAQRNFASPQAQLTNVINSNLSYNVRFPKHPSWNLTTGFRHSQNNQTRQVTLSLPDARFSTGQTQPFANLPGSSTAWYKKATLSYEAQFQGLLNTTDTTLFEPGVLNDVLLGATHNVSFNAPINVLRYFRLSPNIRYQETYYADQRLRVFELNQRVDTSFRVIGPDTLLVFDTTTTSRIRDSLIDVEGFADAARSLTASLSLQTQIFGTARFNLGPLKGIRHIVTPSLNFGFTPDYSEAPFNYYRTVQVDEQGNVEEYLRFPDRPFSPGSLPNEQSLRVGYSIGNRIETKLRTRSDTIARNVVLLQNLGFAGNYDFEADSLKWSPISVSGAQVQLFKDLVRINFNTLLSVYDTDSRGRPIDQTLLSQGRFPFRINQFTYTLAAGMTVEQLINYFTGQEQKRGENNITSLVDNFRLNYNFSRNYNSLAPVPWRTTANTVSIGGRVPISKAWQIRSIMTGYDFISERITYPTLSLTRDLHCWEMEFFWAPNFGAFTFSIRVKPSSLGFISLPYRRGSIR